VAERRSPTPGRGNVASKRPGDISVDVVLSLLPGSSPQHTAGKATFPLPIRSTRPSRSPKYPDQARPIKLYATCSRPSSLVYGRVTIGYWWRRGRVDRVLIGIKCSLDHTRSLHDHFPIHSSSARPIPGPIVTRPYTSELGREQVA